MSLIKEKIDLSGESKSFTFKNVPLKNKIYTTNWISYANHPRHKQHPCRRWQSNGKSEFRFRYRQSDRLEVGFEEEFPNLHDYLEQVERLNLLYTKDSHAFGIQIDEVTLGLNRYSLDGNIKRSWDLTNGTLIQPFEDMYIVPEKIFYSFEDNGIRIELVILCLIWSWYCSQCH